MYLFCVPIFDAVGLKIIAGTPLYFQFTRYMASFRLINGNVNGPL